MFSGTGNQCAGEPQGQPILWSTTAACYPSLLLDTGVYTHWRTRSPAPSAPHGSCSCCQRGLRSRLECSRRQRDSESLSTTRAHSGISYFSIAATSRAPHPSANRYPAPPPARVRAGKSPPMTPPPTASASPPHHPPALATGSRPLNTDGGGLAFLPPQHTLGYPGSSFPSDAQVTETLQPRSGYLRFNLRCLQRIHLFIWMFPLRKDDSSPNRPSPLAWLHPHASPAAHTRRLHNRLGFLRRKKRAARLRRAQWPTSTPAAEDSHPRPPAPSPNSEAIQSAPSPPMTKPTATWHCLCSVSGKVGQCMRPRVLHRTPHHFRGAARNRRDGFPVAITLTSGLA